MPGGGYRQAVNRRESERQLAVLKALGDETRYAMYEELAHSTAALSASDLAERLGIHANTVRLHLERLREVGLVDVEAVHRGTVGRPQHLYFLSAGAPGLGFDPPAHALLAGLLAALAERVGADAAEAAETGRVWGADAGRRTRSRSCLNALEGELAKLGFEPAVRARRRRRHRPHRIPALPVPGAGRGLPRAGVQPAPGPVRRRRRRRRRGKSRGVRDVVRPGAVPRHGGGRIS